MRIFARLPIKSLILVALFPAMSASSQEFVQVNGGFSPFAQGWSSMADFDNDGDLDVVLTGIQSNSQSKSTLFINNNGTYSASAIALEPLQKGVAQWADYDLDGDMDLLLSGMTDDYNRKTILYNNENGTLLKPTADKFPGFANGQAAWFDYDRDGDPDLLISGDTLSLNHFTGLYRNDGENGFTLIPANLPNLVSSAMAFADFDNDGDLDIAISGDSGGGDITRLYRNVEGTFVEVNASFEGVSAGSMAFGDIENDGDMDLFYQGVNFMTGISVFWVYRNDGNDVWTKMSVGLPGLYLGGIAMADFDLDGLIDFIVTGKGTGCGITATVMYHNNGNGGFWQTAFDFPPLDNSSVCAGDYDNDGDADVLLTGISGSGNPSTYLFRNIAGSNQFIQSLTPEQPQNLIAETSGTTITFKWNRPSAMRSSMDALTYNLRIGTTPGGQEIFSANSVDGTDLRTIPAMGNVQLDTIWIIDQLRDGTYFWSVQAISPGFTGSEFAPEQTIDLFTSINETQNDESVKFGYDKANSAILINTGKPFINASISLYDAGGRLVINSNLRAGETSVNVHHLTSGFYIITATINGSVSKFKLIL